MELDKPQDQKHIDFWIQRSRARYMVKNRRINFRGNVFIPDHANEQLTIAIESVYGELWEYEEPEYKIRNIITNFSKKYLSEPKSNSPWKFPYLY